jgi:hypothetical protein
MHREREIQPILVQVREIGRYLELLCERTLYQESQIEHERVRCIKLGMKLSETMQKKTTNMILSRKKMHWKNS